VTTPKAWMPVLRVLDIPRSVAFYRDVIGFAERSTYTDEAGTPSVVLGWGPVELLVSTGDHLGGPPAFTGTLYLRVVGVTELYDRVKDRVELVWPLEGMPYGTREFGVRDPDGYVIAFAQEQD
jgi:uncharacterized glyoxalase superfamily protein PhnB